MKANPFIPSERILQLFTTVYVTNEYISAVLNDQAFYMIALFNGCVCVSCSAYSSAIFCTLQATLADIILQQLLIWDIDETQ